MLIDQYESAIKTHRKETDRLQEQVNKVGADRSVRSEDFLKPNQSTSGYAACNFWWQN